MRAVIKRWVVLFISVLVVVAVVIVAPLEGTTPIASSGERANGRVETMESLSVALQEIASWHSGVQASDVITEDEFSSARLQIKGSQSQGMRFLYNGTEAAKSYVEFDFDADYYINDKGQAYIECEGDMRTRIEADGVVQEISIYMLAKMYSDKDVVYVYYDDALISQDGKTQMIPQILDKWIRVNEIGNIDFLSMVTSLYEHDFALIEIYCQYIRDHLQDGFYEENGIHTMNDEFFQKLWRDTLSISRDTLGTNEYGWDYSSFGCDEGSFLVDLNDSENPRLQIKYKYTLPDRVFTNGVWFDVENTGINFTESELVLSNLNNVDISFPDDIILYDFEDLLGVSL